MGGDANRDELITLARLVRSCSTLKIACYSGNHALPDSDVLACFDYFKIGPYIEARGPLNNPGTNQKIFRIDNGKPADITPLMWQHGI
jgi:anaerobic ribonucleoside-triphosphate reductase activating protein